jgi:hypothetical protein
MTPVIQLSGYNRESSSIQQELAMLNKECAQPFARVETFNYGGFLFFRRAVKVYRSDRDANTRRLGCWDNPHCAIKKSLNTSR